jgi:hypothetical protein
MSLDQMMKNHRCKELVAVYQFIEQATVEEIAGIIAEIRTCHDNILVFNQKHKSLDKVESVAIKGGFIQLNLEEKSEE